MNCCVRDISLIDERENVKRCQSSDLRLKCVCIEMIRVFFSEYEMIFIDLVIDVNTDPNCAKCDIRAVCIRLSNTTGVSCVCLPGFALSPSTGGCVLQGKFDLIVT